jgi:hypothetical protein
MTAVYSGDLSPPLGDLRNGGNQAFIRNVRDLS